MTPHDSSPALLPPEVLSDTEGLLGVVDNIAFYNEDNGFTIARLLVEVDNLEVTIKGILPTVREGETIHVWGKWEEHPTYGKQLAVETYALSEPNTLNGMARYLSAHIKGVGEVLAKRMVKHFGAEIFEVIDHHPEQLLEVPKFPKKVLEEIDASWHEHRGRREVMVLLQSIGSMMHIGEKVYAKYGSASMQVIRQQPYRLAIEVQGIGFKTADQIALQMGYDQNAIPRAEAGLLHTLEEAQTQGNTCLPDDALTEQAVDLLKIDQTIVKQALQRLIDDDLLMVLPAINHPAGNVAGDFVDSTAAGIIAEQKADHTTAKQQAAESVYQMVTKAEKPVEFQKNRVFLQRMDKAEEVIAERLHAIATHPTQPFEIKKIAEQITLLQSKSGVYLSPEQLTAVKTAVKHKVLVLTGGPGTGKTTIIRFILSMLPEEASVALAAPTGKAARRLAETTQRATSTIHRLLEASLRGFGRNAEHPLTMDWLIVDESSMIDTPLMAALLKAMPLHARLLLVGDVDQLPSVGAGKILADVIDCQKIAVIRLEKVFRQAQGSLITTHAHDIRKGKIPALQYQSESALQDFYFVSEPHPEKAIQMIGTLVQKRIPEVFQFHPRQDVQVLTPMHRGNTGTHALNQYLQVLLNPEAPFLQHRDKTRYGLGDRVMQIKNDLEKGVLNGDIGEVSKVEQSEKRLVVNYDGHMAEYQGNEIDQLRLAYAITIHKSQGSEYPAVVIPFSMQHAIMLQRNLLYTAITRAKQLLVIVGEERAIHMAIKRINPNIRHTGLVTRLCAKHF